jgi:hypothetical protein
MLDGLLGKESIEYFRERQLKGVIEQHIESEHAEIDFIEGRGALNFLDIDDVPTESEGEEVDPASIIAMETHVDLPVIPECTSLEQEFVQRVNQSGRKWVILTDLAGVPRLLLDSDAYLRAILFNDEPVNAYRFCHRPVVIDDPEQPLGHVIAALKAGASEHDDKAIEKDIALLWTAERKKVITGADLLGRLFRGM